MKILELRKNKLTNCSGLSSAYTLEELYLAENEITDISALTYLYNLKKLHLRGNKLTTLENQIGYLPALQYLNLREN